MQEFYFLSIAGFHPLAYTDKTFSYVGPSRERDMSEVALRTYLDKIEKDYRQGIATEHSYRGTLKELLEALGAGITATNEPKRIKCGAPDYVIGRDTGTTALTIGYVEAKNIREPLNKIHPDEHLRHNP